MVHELQLLTRTMLRSALLAIALVSATTRVARADGWWETACNADGAEGSGGCANPNNMNGCSCDARPSASHRAAKIGSSLALLALVSYRLGRKRRR